MRRIEILQPGPVETVDLQIVDVAVPEAGPGQLRLRVCSCAVCHTDLHQIEGELSPVTLPFTPGHQIVGDVDALGEGVTGWQLGERAGVAWLHASCGSCRFCAAGRENLCPQAQFTGLHVPGGYAEYVISRADHTFHLPAGPKDLEMAPLLCAGIIGYRSLLLADLAPGERLGLIGFGASAHLAIQMALAWDCEVLVFTRSESHRRHARRLGAAWVGGIDDDPGKPLDRAVLFAPAGELVPAALTKLRPGGTLAINAIHMSPIPAFPYDLIYGERTVRSVANATHADGVAFLALAAELELSPAATRYPLECAQHALADVKHSRLDGAAVLVP
jgi:propanol-preferring alcohol dehydrogenase